MTVYDVARKLIGPVTALGEHNADQARLQNLEEMIELTECLLNDIKDASVDSFRHEASMKAIGMRAKEALEEFQTNQTP